LRMSLMTVARRATPPLGTPQPQGSRYPRESLVCMMVSCVRGSGPSVSGAGGAPVGPAVGSGIPEGLAGAVGTS
jgi:hypothetical protein